MTLWVLTDCFVYPITMSGADAKHFLIFGGTEGIGLATAKRLTQRGALVHLIARNEKKGKLALEQLSNQSNTEAASMAGSAAHTFNSCDATSMKQVNSLCASFSSSLPRLDGILICSGGLNYGRRRITEEGVEVTFAQNYLSRFLIFHRLSPLLAKSGGRAITCLGAGNGGPVDTSDWQLEKAASAWTIKPFFAMAAEQYASMNDLIVGRFSLSYPNVSYMHMFPGIVNTNSARNQNFPAVATFVAGLVMPLLAKNVDETGELCAKMLMDEGYGVEQTKGGALVGERGQFLQIKPIVVGDGTVAGKLWDYSCNLLDALLK